MRSLNGKPADPKPGALRVRVSAQVVHLALLRIGEHLVGLGNFLESLLERRIRVHIRMQFPGQPPVGLLDLLGARVTADAEYPVIVVCHRHP
jgi:hypothetical protein